ncbi:EAL domain-containing protein [Luteibacter sp. 3190]|uniref:putative bifunctional diguanylate cyclase/phosphodiesterase n=1 Tax=Luteibacter sp. 3190 TaxID=2817736 RepID=UPI0028606592|nr:EAL domain-containing protein [Luteibacter sp. 3190]MDR6937025.1 diguanylate cyclase (GGDEF)-like protein [Luteibacter sp. 3190]
MRAPGFRSRLALFFVASLVLVQGLTALLTYGIAHRQLVAEGGRQLSVNAGAFVAQMNDLSIRVANGVQILSLDYGLRSAIGARDKETVLSVLRNHGRRVGAARMQLLGLDGRVQADTLAPASDGEPFAFPDLLASAYDRRSAAVIVSEGKAYWLVVVPIYAPQPVGLVVASIPVDDALLAHMQELSALPRDVELATPVGEGRYAVIARGSHDSGLTESLSARGEPLPSTPTLAAIGGREYLVLAQLLRQPKGGGAVYAVLGYSLDDALRPYLPVWNAWLAVLLVGLAGGFLVAWLVARGVARPVEALAGSARRIAAGDYDDVPDVRRGDEVGDLAIAFHTMTDAIRERERRILHQASHDGVTGLPNRAAAESAVDDDLATTPGMQGALLIVGVNRLPEIVKTVGHALADRLMREAAVRLGQVAGTHFVARATDTQFAVWLRDTGRMEAIDTAFRIMDALGLPYLEADIRMDLGPAVGIALTPGHGERAAILLRRAEVAEFAAVGSTRGVDVYDPEADPHRPERLSLMGELRAAIEADALELWYQPKRRMADGVIDSAEALVRWHRPGRGAVSPELFVAVAEETGTIGRLTRWVLARAIREMTALAAAGIDVTVAVNLSARDVGDPELAGRVEALLRANGLPAQALSLEVTESAVIHEPAAALQVLGQLADMGIDVAIDDFGSGQASFAYLRRLPVTELKIDRMFVQHLATDETDRVIVQSLVELGHRLGYRVTAEGVEDEGSLAFLAEVGCDHAQGYLVGRPMPFADLVARCMAPATGDS